eukprot:TRINITY_DN5998_c0_g1_i13.p1 TRINITY_DN5998_c0_g1~~TRINITY_DN5998_c0_g1_i13.p1  ORF type:complete len:568 (+),score=116.29 TRINITY_DN5998_c0_g1_i13:461-2164(+)
MDSLRKTLSTKGSYKHMGRKSADNSEEQPILLDHEGEAEKSIDQRDLVVDIEAGNVNNKNGNATIYNNNELWRGSSYEFWKDNNRDGSGISHLGNSIESGESNFQHWPLHDDPQSKLIGQFLHKQKASGDISLDMDLEMDELRHDHPLPSLLENSSRRQSLSPKELKVSFQDPSMQQFDITSVPVRQSKYDSSEDEDGESESGGRKHNRIPMNSGEVLKRTSNASSRRNSGILQTKNKSRLMDPLPSLKDEGKKSGKTTKSGQVKLVKSGILKSGVLGRIEEDNEDPFLGEDLPERFKQEKLGAATILQWLSLFVILAALVCSLTVPFLTLKMVWDLHLWKWVVMVLVLICGRLVSVWGIRIVVYLIGRNLLLRKRILYFVYGVRKAVQNCLWLGLVLIAWNYIFDKKVERKMKNKILPIVTKILVCLLVSTLIWLVKTLLVKVLASSFHVSAYFDRIQESLFNQYVIQTPSGPPLIERRNIQEEEEKLMDEVQKLKNAGAKMPADLKSAAFTSGRVIGSGRLQRSPKIVQSPRLSIGDSKMEDREITVEHLHRLNQKNISAWNMKW